MNLPILECRNLSKNYGSGDLALNNFSIALPKGKVIGLLGPNGSGKTTLIKLTAGLLTPTSGELFVGGMPIGIETKRIVSYLPERTYFDPGMRVEETIQYFEDFYEDFNTDKARAMLADLGVPTSKKMKALSKGTKEKVQLILIMSRRAKLYVLDEPIAGVDPAARDYILNIILNNYDEDATILISTHLIADIENILDQVVFIKEGQIVLNSSVEGIREKQGKSVDSLFREVFKC